MMQDQTSSSLQINDQTLISRSNSLLAAVVHDETVMMDIPSGHYYGLDDIGSDIWRRLESPRKFGELVDSLAAEYDADREIIAADVQNLLTLMATHKVVSLTFF
jgi:5'-deoxynucleotidase YfbR-like HD superfamily hydrolase